MIYITGDTHGMYDFHYIRDFFNSHYSSAKDILIILGDVAPIWSKDDSSIGYYDMLGPTILYIDGNHENFDLLEDFPIVNKFGAKMHMLSSNLYHICRGEIINLNDLSFLCVGGAKSIDKSLRIDGVSWWRQENITYKDIDNALNNLKKVNNKVDYVLTHAAPSHIVSKVLGYKTDPNTEALEELSHIVTADHWFFGHYHEDKIIRPKYRLFYHDILTIDAQYKGKKSVKDPKYYNSDKSNFLVTGKQKRTKITPDDLPEWYMNDGGMFFSLKDVKYIKFSQSPFDNHIDKDARVYMSYEKPIKRQKTKWGFHEYLCDVEPWRGCLRQILMGLEKYSPHLKLNKVKALINLNYDRYINKENSDFGSSILKRLYPEIETPILEGTHFAAKSQGMIYCAFRSEKEVNEYIKNYDKKIAGGLTKIENLSEAIKSNGVIEAYNSKDGFLYIISYLPNGKNPQKNDKFDLEDATIKWKGRY